MKLSPFTCLKQLVGFFFLLICFIGCAKVKFKKAQPTSEKALGSFPEELQGKYVCKGSKGLDSIIVNAQDYILVIRQKESAMEQKDSIESSNFSEDDLFHASYFYSGDSDGYTAKQDTVSNERLAYKRSSLSRLLVLKKMNEKYVLSSKSTNGKWKVLIIEPNGLQGWKIAAPSLFVDDKDYTHNFDSISKNETFFGITKFSQQEGDNYLINPSKSEFYELVNEGLFVPFLEINPVNK